MDAIAREKALKAWQRAWKIEPIEAGNPAWLDFGDTIARFRRDPRLSLG